MKSVHAIILSLGLVIAFFVLGLMFLAARSNNQTITSVGLATQRIESDIVKWRLSLSRTVSPEEFITGNEKMRNDIVSFRALLVAHGINDSEITTLPIANRREGGRPGEPATITIVQSLFVITGNISVIESYALNPNMALQSGVMLQESRLEYFYSGLDELKASLLARAAADAKRRALKIADSADAALGPPIGLRAGVFQIKEPYSAEVSDYGMFNTQMKRKEVSVTVHASFRIE